MILCSGCSTDAQEVWFHYNCVNLSKEEAESGDLDKWYCPPCLNARASPKFEDTSPNPPPPPSPVVTSKVEIMLEPDPNSGICDACPSRVYDRSNGLKCRVCSHFTHFECLNMNQGQIDAWQTLKGLREFVYVCGACSTDAPTQAEAGSQTSSDPHAAPQQTSTPSQPGPPHPPPIPEVRIVKGHQDPLSNFFLCDIPFKGEVFRSTEHALQVHRARRFGLHHLARKIAEAGSALEAKHLSRPFAKYSLKSDDVKLMKQLLAVKRDVCSPFRKALRESVGMKLIHSTYHNVDLFWASGLHFRNKRDAALGRFPGKDVLGKLLTELRESLLDESAYAKPRIEVVELGDYHVLILEDGEQIPDSLLELAKPEPSSSPMPRLPGSPTKQSPVADASDVTPMKMPSPGRRRVAQSAPTRSSPVPPRRQPTYADMVTVYRQSKRRPLLNRQPQHFGVLKGGNVKCFKCGERGHTLRVCRYKSPLICFHCKRTGHKRKHCVFPGPPPPLMSLRVQPVHVARTALNPLGTPSWQHASPNGPLSASFTGRRVYRTDY